MHGQPERANALRGARQIADMINRAGPHVLIDLNGHTKARAQPARPAACGPAASARCAAPFSACRARVSVLGPASGQGNRMEILALRPAPIQVGSARGGTAVHARARARRGCGAAGAPGCAGRSLAGGRARRGGAQAGGASSCAGADARVRGDVRRGVCRLLCVGRGAAPLPKVSSARPRSVPTRARVQVALPPEFSAHFSERSDPPLPWRSGPVLERRVQ